MLIIPKYSMKICGEGINEMKQSKENKANASEETVLNGTYALQRPFLFVTKEGKEQSAAEKAYMAFATSKEAASIISAAGAVPLAK